MPSFHTLSRLDGRVAAVTGATGHVGRAVCGALGELGASLVLIDLDRPNCDALGSELTRQHHAASLSLAGNIADPQFWADAPQQVRDTFGRLDIVVHCAAFVGTTKMDGWAVPFPQQTTAAWTAAMDVNVTSFFTMMQEFQSMLEASQHASAISVSSIYGMVGPDMSLYEGLEMANPAAYAASKGGLIQLTRYLATVLAPKIRVNTISPGGLSRNQPPLFQERYIQRTPLKRMGVESDLIGAVGFLASDLSSYVTGINVPVDGGWTAW